MQYSSLKRSGRPVLTRGHTVLPTTHTLIHIWNKAIVDYTSPALFTPATPFAADPIFCEHGSDGMIPFFVRRDIIGDRMILFAANALECIVNGEENPFPAIGDAAYRKHAGGGPSHGHRQHAQKFGKDRACCSGDILSDRGTDRQTHSSQYFASALPSEVITVTQLRNLLVKNPPLW